MVFLLVALILLLLAIWLGIAFANSLTGPISSLISASESVSSGNLKVRIYNIPNFFIIDFIISYIIIGIGFISISFFISINNQYITFFNNIR